MIRSFMWSSILASLRDNSCPRAERHITADATEELKAVKFKPEFAGKLNFYVAAVDGLLKTEQDNPTMGILICKSKNDTVVEYTLKDMRKPIGISEYQITKRLPKKYYSSLPSVEEIEAELAGNQKGQKKLKNRV